MSYPTLRFADCAARARDRALRHVARARDRALRHVARARDRALRHVARARNRALRPTGLAFTLWLAACATQSDTEDVPAPDVATFELTVYPLLLRDCGFPACHGSNERFFRVFGPGRLRLLESTSTFAPATADELARSYARARSMLAHEDSVADSWLLRKPLTRAAGGAEHGGEDKYGRNVYESIQAPGYVALVQWSMSQQQKSSAVTASQP